MRPFFHSGWASLFASQSDLMPSPPVDVGCQDSAPRRHRSHLSCLPGIECAGNKIFLAISPLSQHAHARNITVLCRGLRPLSTSTRSPRAWENVRGLFVLCAQTGCSMRHQHATGVSKCCRSGYCLISFFPQLALRRLLSRRRQDASGQEVGAFPDVVLGT